MMSNMQRITVGAVAIISAICVLFVVNTYSNDRQVLYTHHSSSSSSDSEEN